MTNSSYLEVSHVCLPGRVAGAGATAAPGALSPTPCRTGGTDPSLMQAPGPSQVQAVLAYCVKRVMCGWPDSESNCWVAGEASLEAELCSSEVMGERDVLRQQVKCRK